MILVNATMIGRRWSGIGRYALALVRRFLATGRPDLRVFVNATALGHFSPEERTRLTLVSARLSPDYGLSGHLLRLAWTHWLRARHPEGLLFSPSPLEACAVGAPQVLTVHDLIPLRFARMRPRGAVYFRAWLPRVLARADAVIAVSRATADEVASTYGYPADRIHVIPHGVDPLFACATDGVRGAWLLAVGGAMPHKNVRRVVEAFERVRARFPDWHLRVVGYRQRGRHRARAAGVDALGWVEDQALADLYRRAGALVHASLAEGFGLPVLEAMAAGCPVVASRIPALVELCGDAALYVDPTSVASIAEGLGSVLGDGALRQRLAHLGRARARTFTWEASAARHLAVFDAVLGGRR